MCHRFETDRGRAALQLGLILTLWCALFGGFVDAYDDLTAARWFVKAVLHSHQSHEVKKVSRALMEKYEFTGSLQFYRVVDADSKYIGHAWDAVVLPPLKARLTELADHAGKVNIETRLSEALGSAALLAAGIIRYHPKFPSTLARSSLRQDTMMPEVAAAFDFDDWKNRQEIIYLSALRLIGLGLDPVFHDDIETAIDGMDATSVEVLHAPVKHTGRMMGKLRSIHDHRYTQKPRPALNIDIVRRLVVVKGPEDARAVIHAVSEKYGGLSYMKCLPDLVGTEDALERYNVLPLMLTVPVMPEGVTVGSLLDSAHTQEAWAYHRNNHPAVFSTEQWHADHDAAVAILKTCRSAPVAMHCEIQLMFQRFIPVRLAMHDVYKVCRVDVPSQLYEDTIVFFDENNPPPTVTSLHDAANAGMIDTVNSILASAAAEPAAGGGPAGARQPTVGVNAHGKQKRTPVHLASQQGHLPVVQALIHHQADPNIVSLDHASTPILIAAASGHLGVVKTLLEADATPNLTTTDTNTTALYLAAKNGYVDVVDTLLNNKLAADPNIPRSDTGCTSLHMAACGGHEGVVRSLVNANATVDLKSKYGTPLESAQRFGHAKCAAVLKLALASQEYVAGALGGAAGDVDAAAESPSKRVRLEGGDDTKNEKPN